MIKIGDITQIGEVVFLHRPNGVKCAAVIKPDGQEVCVRVDELVKVKSNKKF